MSAMKEKTGKRKCDTPNRSMTKGKELMKEGKCRKILKKYRDLFIDDQEEEIARRIKQSPDDVQIIARYLSNKEFHLRDDASCVLSAAAEYQADISLAIPALVNSVNDEMIEVRLHSIWALKDVAKCGTNLAIAVPAFIKALENANDQIQINEGKYKTLTEKQFGTDYENLRASIVEAFAEAAKQGIDITLVVPSLIKALANAHSGTDAAGVLGVIAEKWSAQPVEITRILMDFTNSKWFLLEADKNSDSFIALIRNAEILLKKIDELEKQAA